MTHFDEVIIIDDNVTSNLLTELNIKSIKSDQITTSFTDVNVAIERIRFLLNEPEEQKIVVLLDINIPVIDGWGVLERINTFLSERSRNNIRIYILSSSIYHTDKYKAQQEPLINGYIEKPILEQDIIDIIYNNSTHLC
jgi:CheY-like chemotaxis protein